MVRPEQILDVPYDQPIKCIVSVVDNILEVFLNDSVAVTKRLYDFKDGCIGFFVEGGQACFDRIRIGVSKQ